MKVLFRYIRRVPDLLGNQAASVGEALYRGQQPVGVFVAACRQFIVAPLARKQRPPAANPRSIIATTTEIYDYLRLLFANVGQPHCPVSGQPISSQTTSDIVDKILALAPKTRVMLLAPVVNQQKGEFRDVIERLAREQELTIYRHDGFWMPMDSLRDKKVLEDLWQTGCAPWMLW